MAPKKLNNIRSLLGYIRPYWRRFCVACVCMLGFAFFTAITTLMSKLIVDEVLDINRVDAARYLDFGHGVGLISCCGESLLRILTETELLSAWYWAGTFLILQPHDGIYWYRIMPYMVIVAFFMKSIFAYFRTYNMDYIGNAIVYGIKEKVYDKYMELSYDFFTRNRTGELSSRIIYDVELIRNAAASAFTRLLQETLVSVTCLGIMFYISPKLTIVSLFGLPFALIPIVKLGKFLRKTARRIQEKVSDINSSLYETFSGIKIIKVFSMETYERTNFHDLLNRCLKIIQHAAKIKSISSPLMEFWGGCLIAFFIWYGSETVRAGHITKGDFVAFMVALFQLYQPIKRLSGVNNGLQQGIAANERVHQVMSQKPSVVSRPGAEPVGPFTDRIVLDNVSFSYDGREQAVRDISFEVRANQMVALAGPSGSGKTTLVNLIPRLYDVTSGCITIDGKDVRDVDLRSLRELTAFVTQETILFNDTVAGNISCGREMAAERIREAAELANAADFIKRMPEGYDTIIGERGVRLSGGQRQRIAIARAIFKDAPILILDEATSSLDTASEKMIQDAVDHLMENKTTIVVAHRLSTIINADRIVVMENGRIIDSGTHDELIGRKGLYQQLYREFTSA